MSLNMLYNGTLIIRRLRNVKRLAVFYVRFLRPRGGVQAVYEGRNVLIRILQLRCIFITMDSSYLVRIFHISLGLRSDNSFPTHGGVFVLFLCSYIGIYFPHQLQYKYIFDVFEYGIKVLSNK